MALLPIVLDEHRAPHLSRFLQFLETSSATVITLDQWDSFLQFNYTVPLDLQGLEDDGACKRACLILSVPCHPASDQLAGCVTRRRAAVAGRLRGVAPPAVWQVGSEQHRPFVFWLAIGAFMCYFVPHS